MKNRRYTQETELKIINFKSYKRREINKIKTPTKCDRKSQMSINCH